MKKKFPAAVKKQGRSDSGKKPVGKKPVEKKKLAHKTPTRVKSNQSKPVRAKLAREKPARQKPVLGKPLRRRPAPEKRAPEKAVQEKVVSKPAAPPSIAPAAPEPVPVAAETVSVLRAELKDSLKELFSDSQVAARPCTELSVDVARGATAAVHILLNDLTPGAAVTITLRAVGAQAKPPDLKPQWGELLAVPVEKNTGYDGFVEKPDRTNVHVVRRAPFHVYDVIRPIELPINASGPTMALRLALPIPPATPPGRLIFALDVQSNRGRILLRFGVTIHGVDIPRTGAKSFPYTNWFSYGNIAGRHGLQLWSEPYWTMLRRYADLMVAARQNMFMIPLDMIFERTADGPELDVDRLRRIVEVFTAAGMYWIEGGHLASRTGGLWKAPTFDLVMKGPAATSVEGNADLARIGRPLAEAIYANNWQDRWLQHVADEPIAENATDYRFLAGMVRKYMPGIPLIDATMNESLAGALDVWVPRIDHCEKGMEFLESQREVGDRVWFYTCCAPGGAWLNRLLDQQLIRPALYGWAAAGMRLDGFLHWGLNQYHKDQDPFRQSVTAHEGDSQLPAGDRHVVYPGTDGPWSSLRLEAQREGFEDFELLARLAAGRQSEPLDQLVRPVFGGPDGDYTRDPAVLRAARRELLSRLSDDAREAD